MLSQAHRLTTKNLQELFKGQHLKVFSSCLTLRFYPGASFRAALILPRSLKLSSVQAHDVKRQTMLILRTLMKSGETPTWHMAFLPRTAFLSLSTAKKEEEIKTIIAQGKALAAQQNFDTGSKAPYTGGTSV